MGRKELKFVVEPVGNMTLEDFEKYHRKWLDFLTQVIEYGKAIDTFTAMLATGLDK